MIKIIKDIEKLDKTDGFYVKITCIDENTIYSTLVGRIEDKSAIICKLDTVKKYQLQGIGRKLVQEFESVARQKNCDFIKLISSNTESDKFWNKMESFNSINSSKFIKKLSLVRN